MNIHHYTSLSSLALILKNRTIRFTRTDLLDDVQEFHLGKEWSGAMSFFVSSWSAESEENIPQWKMYGDSFKGVRLTLDGNIFSWNKISLEISRKKENGKKYGLIIRHADAPFRKEDMFGKGYILLPAYLSENEFKNKVKYVDDVQEAIDKLIVKTDNDIQTKGNSTGSVFIKSSQWVYQNEFRFALMATTGPNLIYENSPKNYEDDFLNEMKKLDEETNYLNKFKTPMLEYVDLPVSPTTFDNLHVKLGPLAPASLRIIVESLCEKYAPNAVIKESSLSGQIRGKM
ncbi:DUF2971 domain-containing protein [Pectobacterium jejuense]|uniref:DUF2971 domain-containing protein n=1 Tax=Pectobacterium jejuense TaxID=2974022 RepID=UPI0032EFBCE6